LGLTIDLKLAETNKYLHNISAYSVAGVLFWPLTMEHIAVYVYYNSSHTPLTNTLAVKLTINTMGLLNYI